MVSIESMPYRKIEKKKKSEDSKRGKKNSKIATSKDLATSALSRSDGTTRGSDITVVSMYYCDLLTLP